jgi:hypothetical protein
VTEGAETATYGGCAVRCAIVLFACWTLIGALGCNRKQPALSTSSKAKEPVAAVAALNATPQVADFVLAAQSSIRIQTGGLVNSGDIAAKGTGSGPFLSGGVAIDVGSGVKIQSTHNLIADSVRLGSGVTVGDVQTNHFTDGSGAKHGSVTGLVTLPALPTAASVSPGSSNLTLGSGATVSASPGKFATVSLGSGAKLRLASGTYEIATLSLGSGTRLDALGPVQLRVAGRFTSSDGIVIGPASGVTLSARDIRIEISGINGTTGDLTATPKAAVVGTGALTKAVMLVPNGTLALGTGLQATGAFIAREIDVGTGAQITFQDGFTAGGGCTTASCNDNNPCTVDACSGGACTHASAAAGTGCADADLCNGAETCDGAGSCKAGTPVTCQAQDQCHVAGTCTAATGACSNPAKADGTACSDGNACTSGDNCKAGACAAGTAVATDDGNACTNDSCDPTSGVKHLAVAPGSPCPDGDACNGAETCSATGACQPGTAVVCTAADQCHTAGSCDTATGLCSKPAKADGSACDDGSACTLSDACHGGVCAGTAVVCVAQDQCHVAGSCDTATGQCSNPAKPDDTPCDDGKACTQSDACHGGTCSGSTVVCAAQDQCHVAGTCNSATGQCSNPTKPDNTPCDDGKSCTQGDTCHAGTCSGSLAVCVAQDQCHLAGTCDSATGQCSNPAKPNDTPCDDGQACTQGDTCQSGTCNGSPVMCVAQDQCHVPGTCDASTGLCSNPAKPEQTPCDDGLACTHNDICLTGTCGGTATICTAQDQCHIAGTCDASTGKCSNPTKPDKTPCDDGQVCTQNDICQAGACGGTAIICTAQDQCHIAGVCDATTGQCSNPTKSDLTPCDDGKACTEGDICRSGACSGTATICTAQDQCHLAGSCNTTTGKCSNPAKPDQSPCDDANSCTLTDTCIAGLCTPGTAKQCPPDTCSDSFQCDPATGNCTSTPKPNGGTCGPAGMVIGRVVSDATGLPVAGTSIQLDEQTIAGRPDGRYSITTDKTAVLVIATRDGFTSVERAVTVTPQVGTVAVDARLTPLAAPVSLGTGGGTVNVQLARFGDHPTTATLTVPSGTFAGPVALRVTALSPQGLPGALPLGWSPIAALDAQTDAGSAAQQALSLSVQALAMSAGVVQLASYDRSAHAWRLEASRPVGASGTLTASLPHLGAYAFVLPDADGAPAVPAVGDLLPGLGAATLPSGASAAGAGQPASLPASGGLVEGRALLSSPSALPSGTVLQAAISETFTLGSGAVASSDTRLEDLALFRAPLPQIQGATTTGAAAVLGASFAIQPSRAYDPGKLSRGNIHVDVLGGRESTRGTIANHDAVSLHDANLSLLVPAGAVSSPIVADLEQVPPASFVPSSSALTPLVQANIDLSGATLTAPAELHVANLTAASSDTILLARLERTDGIAYPAAVAFGTQQGSDWVFTSAQGLPGITREGTYIVYRSSSAFGFVAGTTTASGAPMQALVSIEGQPFVALSGADGAYRLLASPALVAVHARVPGTNLVASGAVNVSAGATATLDLALVGAVTNALVDPENGAVAVPVTTQVTITTTSPLDPTSVLADNIKLFAGPVADQKQVPVHLALSASATSLALIPDARLSPAVTYTLEASGLRDSFSSAVAVPVTSFTTKAETAPVYDTNKVQFSMPDASGNVAIDVPAGGLPAGTRMIVTNEGNGAVVSFTVGNDGSLHDSLLASIDDRLVISITDPLGNTTTFVRSQYVGTDGKVAIGPGGGVVMGPGGVELRVPEGALEKGATFDIKPLGTSAFPQLPDLEGAVFASGLEVDVTGAHTFNREVDIAFPKPADAPDGAVYYVFRRIRATSDVPLAGGAAFEVLDHALVEGTGPSAKVVTASPPFSGLWQFIDDVSEALNPIPRLNVTSSFVLAWSYQSSQPNIPVGALLRGRVVRTAWGSGANGSTPQANPVANALVSLVGTSGLPLVASQPGNPAPENCAVTQSDGTFALWVPFTVGSNARVAAVLPVPSGGWSPNQPCPGTPNAADTIACVTAIEDAPVAEQSAPSWVRSYRRYLHANFTLLPQQPAPPPPDLQVSVLREVDGQRQSTNGVVLEGQPLLLRFQANAAISSLVDIAYQGVTESVKADNDPLVSPPTGTVKIARYTPPTTGTYTVTGTATPQPVGSPFKGSATFRVVAAAGDATTPVLGPPGVITARTDPQAGAQNVRTSVFPTVTFTEPVKNVFGHAGLYECATSSSCTGVVAATLTGVRSTGPAITLDSSNGPTADITALTIEPTSQLKFGALYKLILDDQIIDLDDTLDGAPPAQHLARYESSFQTLQPQALMTPSSDFSSAGVVALGDRAYLVQNDFTYGLLRVFDVSDPVTPTEVVEAQQRMLGRPMDLDVSPDGDDATVVVVTGPADSSLPSNLRIYKVPAAGPSQWVGAASLTSTAVEGIVQRVAVNGNFAYTVTTQKGIQVVDLGFAKTLFSEHGGDVSAVRVPLNTDGEGFGHEAVSASIPVYNSAGRPAFLADLKVPNLNDGFVQPVVVATGELSLVLANPQTAEILFKDPFPDHEIFRGRAVAVSHVANRDLAAIVGQQGSDFTLLVVDVTDPHHPVVAGESLLLEKPIDVSFRDGQLLVGGENAVTVVSIETPEHPMQVGRIDGIAGRIATSASGAIVTVVPATSGGDVNLGGLRTATLGPLTAVLPIASSFHKRVQQGSVTTIETSVPIDIPVLAVAMDPSRPATGTVEIRTRPTGQNAAPSQLLMTLPATLQTTDTGFRGKAQIPQGTSLPYDLDLTATAIVRQSPGVPSKERPIPLPTPYLRVDSDNNTRLGSLGSDDERSDESAASGFQFRSFVFWNIPASARTRYLNSGCTQGATVPFKVCLDLKEDDLQDWASFKVRVHGASSSEPKGKVTLVLDGHKWFLSNTVGEGKERLSSSPTAREQLAAIKKEAYESDSLGRIEVPSAWLAKEDNSLLLSCFDCDRLDPYNMILEYKEGNSLAILSGANIDIEPLEQMATMYTAHSNGAYTSVTGSSYSPLSLFEGISRWRELPADTTKLTVVVHGFNVPQSEAEDTFFTQYVKRLYWVGHPVFDGQGSDSDHPAAVGISWPGDQDGGTNFPPDEFHAFQTGIPLSRLLKTLSVGPSGKRRIDVVAHSLGNIVVNSALAFGDGMEGVVHAYVMNQAAVPAEAFKTTYIDDSVLRSNAANHGYPSDDIWAKQWLAMNRDFCSRDFCGDCTEVLSAPTPLWPIGAGDLKVWCQKVIGSAPLSANAMYGYRWSSARYEHSPWRGVFADNVASTMIYNTYSTGDVVMGLGYQEMALHQKPFITINDDRSISFWADLGLGGTNQLYLWDGSEQLAHADQVRHWAELTLWFSPLSRGAAVGPINVSPPVGANIEDVDFSTIADAATAPLVNSMGLTSTLGPLFGAVGGVIDPALVSHGYMVYGTLSQVWCGYVKVQSLIETGVEAHCP